MAYDDKNHSEDTEQARSTPAEQCNDCLVGELCRDAPPPAVDLRVTQGCEGAPLRLDWNYAAGNYTTHPDFQGFRVVRCQGSGCTPLDPIQGGLGDGPRRPLAGHAPARRLRSRRTSLQLSRLRRRLLRRWLEGESVDAGNDPGNNAATTEDSLGLALGFDRASVVEDLQTTLTAGIDPVENTIPVASTVGWAHRRLLINSEIIERTGSPRPALTQGRWWRGRRGPSRSLPPRDPARRTAVRRRAPR